MAEKLLTIGTFDIPHIGHANLIRQFEKFTDDIVIGVNSDKFVLEYKGRAPSYNQRERMAFMRLLGHTVRLNESAGEKLILSVLPNIIGIGSDWAGRDYLSQIGIDPEFLTTWSMSLLYVPYTLGISTTDIRRRANAI